MSQGKAHNSCLRVVCPGFADVTRCGFSASAINILYVVPPVQANQLFCLTRSTWGSTPLRVPPGAPRGRWRTSTRGSTGEARRLKLIVFYIGLSSCVVLLPLFIALSQLLSLVFYPLSPSSLFFPVKKLKNKNLLLLLIPPPRGRRPRSVRVSGRRGVGYMSLG